MPASFYSYTGVPLPTLQWYKDAVSIGKLHNPRYKMLASGGLRIQHLRPEDSGIFQCFASNEGGEIQTYTYLDVTSEYCPSGKTGHPGCALGPGLPDFWLSSICSGQRAGRSGHGRGPISGGEQPMC